MKKIISTKVITIIILALFMASCLKFEPAEVKLTATYNYENKIATCNATIVNNGGCTNFTEQGAMCSIYKEPALVDKYAEIVCSDTNVKETSFNIEFHLPLQDTIYYIRAYVKTNAGIGYSNIVEIKT